MVFCDQIGGRVASNNLAHARGTQPALVTLQLSVLAIPLDTSHYSLWSFPAVWRHSPERLTTECDADCREERESVLSATRRTSAHCSRLVQPTRPTGVEGRRRCGKSIWLWYGCTSQLPKLPTEPRWNVRVQSDWSRELLGDAACVHWWVLHLRWL